jgi:hypothetical protein
MLTGDSQGIHKLHRVSKRCAQVHVGAPQYRASTLPFQLIFFKPQQIHCSSVEHQIERGRSGPEAGRSAPVGRTVRACAEQIRVPSFVLRLLAKIMG